MGGGGGGLATRDTEPYIYIHVYVLQLSNIYIHIIYCIVYIIKVICKFGIV